MKTEYLKFFTQVEEKKSESRRSSIMEKTKTTEKVSLNYLIHYFVYKEENF